MQAMVHEKLAVTIQDQILKYQKVWHPWIEHFLSPHFDESLVAP